MNSEEFAVAVYFVERCYGGLEEGGWHYDAGKLCGDVEPIICQNDEVSSVLATLRDTIEKKGMNVGRRGLSSVLSGGVYMPQAFRGRVAPPHFPATRPRYE